MALIRANRESINDRFSVLGFTVRTDLPLFEIGLATDPELLKAENQEQRTSRNFFTSQLLAAGPADNRYVPGGRESVYLVPPSVVARFVGQSRLYFGLATYQDKDRSRPISVKIPDRGHMYVSLSGLSERGLRRTARSGADDYGGNGRALSWGGDALVSAPPPNGNGHVADGNGAANGRNGVAAAPEQPAPYSDGYPDELWQQDETAAAASPANGNGGGEAAMPAPAASLGATLGATRGATRGGARAFNADPDDEDSRYVEPDAASAPTARELGAPGPQPAYARAQEIIEPYYDSRNPATALQCTLDAFSLAREEWFAGVPDTRHFPHSAICQLRMTAKDGRRYRGTGFYIGDNRILTCAHNLHGMRSCQIIPGRNGAGNQPFGDATVTSWRIAPGYSGSGDWDKDLAVIDNVPIAAPNGQYFRFLRMTPSDRLPVVVCGYSAGSRTVPELNRIIDGDKQHLHGGYVREQPTPNTIDYPILSLMGASGSPVYTVDDSGGSLEALICAVHVSGEPVDRGLNRGCFITPQKIEWIEGRAASFALGGGMQLRDRTPVHRSPVRASAPQSRAQGQFDLLPADLKLRVFIPSPAILMKRPVVSDRAFGGDGRGFQHEGGTSRAEIRARLHFGDGQTRARLDVVDRHWGESTEYNAGDTEAVGGKPGWYRNLKAGARPIARETLGATDRNLSARLGGSSSNGIISMQEGSIVVSFHVEGGLPLAALSPDIDANLAVHVRVKEGRIQARVVGSHDGFPAFELYANGERLYGYNPLDHGAAPLDLVGSGHWDVRVDSDYVDSGPASETRIIGPVRIGSSAQALSQSLAIPLDPGIGGQSIGLDALAPGDIIVSTARHAVSYAIRAGTLSAVSHAMIYAGDGNVVEAVGEGVRIVPLADAIDDAILAVAYRDARVDAAKAQTIVEFAQAQDGRPYNYEGAARIGHRILFPFSSRVLDAIRNLVGVDETTARSFFCSELVYAAFEHAGIPLATQGTGPGTPDDLVQLRHENLIYVGHLKARDELLGIALALSTKALEAPASPGMRVRALEDDGPSDYPVPLIPQPDKNSCWAATMAMLLSYRRNASYSPETLAEEVGGSLTSSYDWDLLKAVRDRYGFEFVATPSNTSFYFTPREWARWLSMYGPLWVVLVGAPHAVVVAGIRGDLDDPAETQVKLLNPWDTRQAFDADPVTFNPPNDGYEDWLSFADFAADFGNMAEPDYGNWRVLYLPERVSGQPSASLPDTAVTSQSLGVRPGRLRLARAPAQVRALEYADSGNGNGAAGNERIEPIEPSRIAGARMHVQRGQDGRSTWALDQLEGMKSPASPPETASTEPVEVHVELGEWPALEGAPAPLPLTVGFRALQGAVGDVRIAAVTPAADSDAHEASEPIKTEPAIVPAESLSLDHGVDVMARIDDETDVDGVAALKVGIDYRFVGLAEGSPVARIELRLLGDGRYERQSRWVTTS